MGLFSRKNSNSEKPAAPVYTEAVIPQQNNADELIAVLSAAIAAFEGAGNTDGFVARRINRDSGLATVWNNAGRADCMRTRRI